MSVENFPLAWRWTQKSHAELPPSVLANIRPIDSTLAHQLYQRGENALLRQAAVGERSCRTEDKGEAREWLRWFGLPADSRVTVVWSHELGVSLPWGTFVEHWEDFCYPSSDDAFIFLPSGSDVISYEHHEMFLYKSGVA
jgi:hypothetical protein